MSHRSNPRPVFGVPAYYLGRPNTAFLGRYRHRRTERLIKR